MELKLNEPQDGNSTLEIGCRLRVEERSFGRVLNENRCVWCASCKIQLISLCAFACRALSSSRRAVEVANKTQRLLSRPSSLSVAGLVQFKLWGAKSFFPVTQKQHLDACALRGAQRKAAAAAAVVVAGLVACSSRFRRGGLLSLRFGRPLKTRYKYAL